MQITIKYGVPYVTIDTRTYKVEDFDELSLLLHLEKTDRHEEVIKRLSEKGKEV